MGDAWSLGTVPSRMAGIVQGVHFEESFPITAMGELGFGGKIF